MQSGHFLINNATASNYQLPEMDVITKLQVILLKISLKSILAFLRGLC